MSWVQGARRQAQLLPGVFVKFRFFFAFGQGQASWFSLFPVFLLSMSLASYVTDSGFDFLILILAKEQISIILKM